MVLGGAPDVDGIGTARPHCSTIAAILLPLPATGMNGCHIENKCPFDQFFL